MNTSNIRMNAGYIITDSIHIGETEFVIGVHSTQPSMFVTWACRNGDNYFWGHYMTTRDAAEHDLVERAKEQLQLLDSIRGRCNNEKGTPIRPKIKEKGTER